MKLLTPDKTIAALEDYVIKPNLLLYPTLGVIIKPGDKDSPDYIYLRSIEKKAAIYTAKIVVKEAANYKEAATAIQELRHDHRINGIIILSHFDKDVDRALFNMIPPRLDVDCVSALTFGHLITSHSPVGYRHGPCAAVAAMKLLEYEGLTDLSEKKVAVIGRSLRVGRPLAEMLTQNNATVTCFHSQSGDFENNCELFDYDIIISAVGKPKIWNLDTCGGGQERYFIDIGINVDENGLTCGDFDIDSFKNTDISITPVPGCVGKLATVVLFAKLYANAAYVYGDFSNV